MYDPIRPQRVDTVNTSTIASSFSYLTRSRKPPRFHGSSSLTPEADTNEPNSQPSTSSSANPAWPPHDRRRTHLRTNPHAPPRTRPPPTGPPHPRRHQTRRWRALVLQGIDNRPTADIDASYADPTAVNTIVTETAADYGLSPRLAELQRRSIRSGQRHIGSNPTVTAK